MPGTGVSTERVAIRPSTHGTFTSYFVVWVARSGKAEHGEGGGRRLGLPHRLDGGDLHLLVLAGGVAALIAQHDDRQRRGQAEARRHRHRALGEFAMAAAQQIIGADRQHEHRAA